MKKQHLAMMGLIFITFLAAIQYIFLRNVPDSVPTFAFLCITNVIGFVILGLSQFKKLATMQKFTIAKGVVFALELTGFNFFLLIGSRNMDSVIISSVVSMYFIFITPLLLLLKKKVNFFSGIASVIAVIALLLMFGADTGALFESANVIYLLLSSFFFAVYVVSVSQLGANEDSVQLTMAQMIGSIAIGFVGWILESAMGYGSFALPTEPAFWISACFIGLFIRAVYGLIQMACQKIVPAINASLIFSSEIIITLVLEPFLCRVFGETYTPANTFQIIGCILFIIATLLVEPEIMSKVGFSNLEAEDTVEENGNVVQHSTVAKKMIFSALTFTMVTLVATMVVSLTAIHFIRSSAVDNSTTLGLEASQSSADALTNQLENKMRQLAEDKANLAEAKLNTYSTSVSFAASYAGTLLDNPQNYSEKEVFPPSSENAGVWFMQRALADPSIPYETLQKECQILGNMVDIFVPIIRDNENVATIYLGTESGLMLAYDPNSDSGDAGGEAYFEFRNSEWYTLGKAVEDWVFTKTYQDAYGRGLTVTCSAPIRSADGTFRGCVAMDILMNDLNNSMVNDGIIDPSVATMIDDAGNIIAGKNIDPKSEQVWNIFDAGVNNDLMLVGKTILEAKDGITSTGTGGDAVYVAFSTVDSTDWTLCITSPVAAVIEPAVQIRERIDDNTRTVVISVVQGVQKVVQECLVLMAVILLTITFFVGRYSRKISDPLIKLEQDVQKISQGNFDLRTQVTTDDEIGMLAKSFNFMTDSIQKYMVDLKEATAKEERIASELAVATNIQADMLPSEFPAFPDRKEFDIFASMTPAKEVGGDFYDFFLIDQNHLGMVMADVSGKGVPAALFMVIAKTLLKNRAQAGGTPSQILMDVNNQLCEGNKSQLFVTVWFAILDLTTGKGQAANAGHEHPAICRANGEFELVKYRHSPAMGMLEGIPYRQHDFELFPGDRLFVYTDGVPEATNGALKMFGTARMMDALNAGRNGTLEQLLRQVHTEVENFVGDAPQFDDLTMLGFQYYGEGGKQI